MEPNISLYKTVRLWLVPMPGAGLEMADRPWLIPFLGLVIVLLILVVFVLLWYLRQNHKMAKALLESEARYRMLFESAVVGIGISSVAGRVFAMNKAMSEITGYTLEEYANISLGATYVDLEDRKRFQEIIQRDGAVENFEVQLRNKKGEIYWASVSGRLIQYAGEAAFLTTLVDVTARKRAEETLREREERLRLLAEITSDYAYAVRLDVDGNTRYEWLTEAFTEITGFTQTELETQGRWQLVVHPDDFDIVAERVQSRYAGEVDVSEFRIVTKSGEVRWLRDYARPVWDDKQQRVVRIYGAVQDITSRKRMEEALRESESRFRRAMENIPDVVVIYDQDLRIQYINAATQQITGRPVSDFIGRREEEIWSPEVYGNYLPTLQEAFETKTIRSVDVVLNLPEGGLRALAITCVPLLDEQGEVREVMGITHDFTKRRQDEQALLESEEKLRLFIEHAPASLAMFDQNMCYLAVSRRWLTDYQLEDGEDIIGRSHYAIFPEIPDRWKAVHRRCLAGEVLKTDEDVFVRLDGAVQQLRWEVHPWYTGDREIGGIVIFSEDITPIKHAEDALRESQRTLATLMSNLPGMAYRCLNDPQWTMLLVSEGATTLTGYEPDDLLENRYVPYADLIHPDDAEAVWTTIQAAVQEQGTFQLTYRIITRDGTEKWVWEQGRAVPLPDGMVVLEGFITDITARQAAEVAEREQRKLAEALSNATVTLNQTLDLDNLFEKLLDIVGRVVPYDAASMLLLDGGNFTVAASRNWIDSVLAQAQKQPFELPTDSAVVKMVTSGQPVIVEYSGDGSSLLALSNFKTPHTRLGVPVMVQEEVIGVLFLIKHQRGYYTQQHVNQLMTFANQLAIAYNNAMLYERQRDLTQQLVLAQEEERRRVAHELHDDVGQSLTALRMSLQILSQELSDDAARRKVAGVIDLTQTTADQLRRVSYGLRPPALDTLGLNLALSGLCRDFAEHTDLIILYTGEEVVHLTETAQISLYRILQESLTNVARHALATEVRVTLSVQKTDVILEVHDNGQGFDASQILTHAGRTGLGLLGMRERAELLNGCVVIQSEPGQGTSICVKVPQEEIL